MNMTNKNPLVAIDCITYNHGKFIRDTLEGFVMQRTDFPFVAIVHDDASTDGTADIIREYAGRYPDIIKPILETENLYSKGDDSLGRVMREAIDASGAKYVALCEGDDYWTDPLKLQKQIDFMEANPDYSMCFHNAIEHWEDGRIPDHPFAPLERRDYDYKEVGSGWNVPTASAVVKKNILDSELYKKATECKSFIYGDILIWLTAAEFGKIFCLGEIMAVYRRHAGGLTFSQSPNRLKQIIAHSQALPVIFGKKYKFSAIDTTVNLALGKSLKSLKERKFKTASEYFMISMKYAPFETIKRLLSNIIRK